METEIGGPTLEAGAPFAGVDPSLLPGSTDAALLASLEAAFAARRSIDASIARLAGEIAERSRTELGVDSLARRSGHANAAQLIQATGRIGKWDAARFCKVGTATASRFSLAGEKLPPQFETLAVGVNNGVVTVEAASHIITQLNAARSNADADAMVAAESALVDFASVGTADDVRRVAAQWRDHLDTDGVEPREEQLVAGRCLKRFWLSNGLKRYQLDADPERAAYLDAVVDAEIAAAFRATAESGSSEARPRAPEARPRAPEARPRAATVRPTRPTGTPAMPPPALTPAVPARARRDLPAPSMTTRPVRWSRTPAPRRRSAPTCSLTWHATSWGARTPHRPSRLRRWWCG